MERLNKKEMELLIEQGQEKPCISIFMPTRKGREKAKENSTRFKNLLNQAEQHLEDRDMSALDQKDLTAASRQLISDSSFWANQSEGLAYFISPGFIRYYRLPLQFKEMAVVGKSFHLKPLFELVSSDGQFYVLALSQKNVRFLRGTRSIIEEMDLSDIVTKFEAEFGEEMLEKRLQLHTGTPGAEGERSAIYHGHGGEIDGIQRERLLNYFRFIDREIQRYLSDTSAPLLLACVDYLAPLYRETSKYPHLFEEIIKGNPDNLNVQDLHKKAWDTVEPIFKAGQEEVKNRYRELKGTGKTSNNILEILPAAFHGRISDLFITPGVQQWGTYEPETEKVDLTEEPFSESKDLIDLAAAKVFLSNGNVYAVKTEQAPDSGGAIAVFRW